MSPQQIAQKVKAGRGWLVVRNSGTLCDTDYERVADEIVDALNKRRAYRELVKASVSVVNAWYSIPEGNPVPDEINAGQIEALHALLKKLGEAS